MKALVRTNIKVVCQAKHFLLQSKIEIFSLWVLPNTNAAHATLEEEVDVRTLSSCPLDQEPDLLLSLTTAMSFRLTGSCGRVGNCGAEQTGRDL